MSFTILEVKRPFTFWYGEPMDKQASKERLRLHLETGKPNRVDDAILGQIVNDERQGPLLKAYVEAGDIRMLPDKEALDLVEGRRAPLRPNLTPTEQAAIDAGETKAKGKSSHA